MGNSFHRSLSLLLDAFGNRTRKLERNQQTRYFYNAADQLIREEGDLLERTYQYDARGNLTSVCHGTSMEHRYLYDAANRLSLSMNAEGRVSGYQRDRTAGERVSAGSWAIHGKGSYKRAGGFPIYTE